MKITEKFGHHVMDSAPEPFDEEIVKVSGSLGSHATLYTRTAIEKIINEPITTHIDIQIQQWIRSKNIRTYGVHPEIVGTIPNNLGSNLADTFPPLANQILDTVEITNNTPLGWSMSENFMKIGPFNVNGYIVGLTLLGLFLPWYLSIFLFAWIFLETVKSKDIWNGFRFAVFLSAAITLHETGSRIAKSVSHMIHPTKKRK
jgi:hypothetical protein